MSPAFLPVATISIALTVSWADEWRSSRHPVSLLFAAMFAGLSLLLVREVAR